MIKKRNSNTNNYCEKIIIRNYDKTISLDFVFSELPMWQILSEYTNERSVLYKLDRDPDIPEQKDKRIIVLRTILDGGTIRLDIDLEDTDKPENTIEYTSQQLGKLN